MSRDHGRRQHGNGWTEADAPEHDALAAGATFGEPSWRRQVTALSTP
ncbi:MAG: hypothetical protein JXP73_16930 [Deltaproteobacteria bacterium]|nr:hypothetical protein [Deltaproteobacteria bacterium]